MTTYVKQIRFPRVERFPPGTDDYYRFIFTCREVPNWGVRVAKICKCCKSELGYVVHCFMTRKGARESSIMRRAGAKLVVRNHDAIGLSPTKAQPRRHGRVHLAWCVARRSDR